MRPKPHPSPASTASNSRGGAPTKDSDIRALSLDAACLRRKCDEAPAIGYAFFKAWLPHLAGRMQMQQLRLLDLYGGGG